MIVYLDIFGKLKEKGWTSYQLRTRKILSESTMTMIRAGKSITMDTLDTLCRLCECQPGELLTWVPDQSPEE